MPKEVESTRRPSPTDRQTERDRVRAERKPAEAAGGLKSYRVRAGHTVTVGEERDGGTVMMEYGPGETVKMTEKDAKARPWAVEPAGKRSHAGQTSRLEREIATLRARLRETEARAVSAERRAAGRGSSEEDGNREDALRSIRERGDNHAARNEPDPHNSARETRDQFDRDLDDAFVASGGASDDELAEETGMRGMGREREETSTSGSGTQGGENKGEGENK
jgi:hypothetical protein